MNFEKPLKLISLLTSLRDEPIKSNYERIYIQIAKEAMAIEFKHNPSEHFEGIVVKFHYIVDGISSPSGFSLKA